MPRFYILFLFYFISNSVNALTCTTTVAGNWQTNSTWDCATFPSGSNCPDTIIIDHNVLLNSSLNMTSCPALVLIVNANLTFRSGRKLYLPANSRIVVNSGGSIIPLGGGGNSNLIQIGGVSVWNAGAGTVTGGSPPTIIGTSTLPITLSYFYAEIVSNSVRLHWETLSEINNDYFEIEFSTDGINYKIVDKIDGVGNSSITNSYQTVFYQYKIGVNYFRLKQTDFDGTYTYSNPISVNFSDELKRKVFPNPNIGELQIDTKYSENVVITNLSGQTVHAISEYKGEIISLSHIPAGIYLIQYYFNGLLFTEKFIKH